MIIMFRNKKMVGYTLVEALIYLAILAIIITAVMGITVSMIKALAEVRANQALSLSAQSSLELIVRQVRAAETIVVEESVFGVNPGRLFLESVSADESLITYDFYVSGDKILLSTDGAAGVSLLNENVIVDSFIVRYFSGTNSEGVRAELEVRSNKPNSSSRTFYAAAIRR